MGWASRATFWLGLQPPASQIADLEATVAARDATIDGLEEDVEELEGDVADLTADLATVTAERDAAQAKLVPVTAWVDLTATITTKCAGAAAADPDSLAAGLTVSTTTGTFDGTTVSCNQFGWTTHNSTNDGHSETLNYDLGTIASFFPAYDPAIHAIQLVADLVAAGTLNGTSPILGVAIAASGTLHASGATAAGWSWASGTALNWLRTLTGSAAGIQSGGDPATGRLARCNSRSHPFAIASRRLVVTICDLPATAKEDVSIQTNGTFAATDKLFLCIGQGTTTQAAISGVKVRFRARLLTVGTNLDYMDLDFGCQA